MLNYFLNMFLKKNVLCLILLLFNLFFILNINIVEFVCIEKLWECSIFDKREKSNLKRYFFLYKIYNVSICNYNRLWFKCMLLILGCFERSYGLIILYSLIFFWRLYFRF